LSDNIDATQILRFGTRVPFCVLPFGPLSLTFYRDSCYRSVGSNAAA
jgi:hypothetical protein